MSASDRLLGASGPNRSALGRVLRSMSFDEPVQLAITVVVVLLTLWLVLYPLGWLVWAMFHKGAPGAAGDWTGENLKVLLDAEYWQLVGRSLIVGVGTTLLATFIGVPLAWVTVKTDMPGKRFVEIVAILPFFTSTFIGALAWIFLGNPASEALAGNSDQRVLDGGNYLGDWAVHGALHLSLCVRCATQHGHEL